MESRKNGTDEPICRAEIEMQMENKLVDTVGKEMWDELKE